MMRCLLIKGLAILSSLSLIFTMALNPGVARELSKSASIYQTVQDRVVTMVTAVGSGSGFLVDDAGLILTNSHVVNESLGNMRVRFGNDKIVKGITVENDREADLAIVWVNLENIGPLKALPLFSPPNNEPLLLSGEKVLAIGSPLEWATLEKTLTEGIVGKYENDIIRHDARINHGNSGGPLFNFDGQVVGVNTFGVLDPDFGAVSSSVSINKALPLIEKAKQTISKMEKPPAALLPDIPRTPYYQSLLATQKITKRKQAGYPLSSYYFNLLVSTPVLAYQNLAQQDALLLDKRKKRALKKGFDISDDEYDSKNQIRFYNYTKPVVTVSVIPNPKLTNGSIVATSLTTAAAIGITVASFGLGAGALTLPIAFLKEEYKKDFFRLTLHSVDGSVVCEPYATGRTALKKDNTSFGRNYYINLTDKTYEGRYEFDSRCFETSQPLEFTLYPEGVDKPITLTVPEKIQSAVVSDFKPYWDYVKAQTVKAKLKP